MAVDVEAFTTWANDRFGVANIKVRKTGHGDEYMTHSMYAKMRGMDVDDGFNLWMNPTGGKAKNPEFGSFRCWKTDTMGSLVRLVSDVDGISWEDAEMTICGTSSLRAVEQKVHDFFDALNGFAREVPELDLNEEAPVEFTLPDFTFLIDKLHPSNTYRQRALAYLRARKIPIDGMYVCTDGDYKNRIIIPYYDREGKLIFYNGRTLSENEKVLRYMKAPTDLVKQENVLFFPSWPQPKTKVFLMEGELDSKSLELCGLASAACGGKFLSEIQLKMMKEYHPVLAFDADNAGLQATLNIGKAMLEFGFPRVGYVRPPMAYKDWNKMLMEKDTRIVREYALKYEKPFTNTTASELRFRRL